MRAELSITKRASPNCGERRGGVLPDMIVLHYTAMETADAAIERLCDPEAEVSAHYVICAQGHVTQLVDEAARAWHAGAGSWGDVSDVNSRSIGIELANRGDHPFSEPQMTALETLIRGIMARWDIPPERVIGHQDMAPERKYDPGPRFDWRRLARQGLSIWPALAETPLQADRAQFCADAHRFGYDAAVGEPALLEAFRARFRPWAEGELSAQDTGVMRALAEKYPAKASV